MFKMQKKIEELDKKIKLENNDLKEVVDKLHRISTQCKRKFNESVDIVINLNINLKKEQGVRGTLALTHGTGKKFKIAVFAEGKEADMAKELGVEIVGGEELINKIKNGEEKLDVQKCIATPAMMLKLTKIASILGKRGIMPNQKDGTITDKISEVIKDIMKGIVFFNTDKQGYIHASIGRVSFSPKQLEENVKEFVAHIKKFQKNPKIAFINKIYLSSTMGNSLPVNIASC
jgi:large subunit ribosomal protein L1